MNAFRDLLALPRAAWSLALATLINRLGTMALPFLVIYLTRHLGFSPTLAGFVFGVYGGTALIVSPLAGRLCDRIGARRMVWISLGLAGMALLLYPLATTKAQVIVATIAFAATNEAFRPAAMTLVGSLVEPAKRKPAFALNRLAINLGMSFGPAIGGLLVDRWFPAIFLVDGATALVAAALLFLTFGRASLAPPSSPAGASPDEAVAPARSSLRDGSFVFFLAAVFMTAAVFFQIEGAMPLYLTRDLHLSAKRLGLLFPINTGLILTLEVPLNAATARWPHRRSLALGALLCGLGVGALALARGFWSAAATVVVWTFGEMILFPALSAYVSDVSPKHQAGQYMGLYTTAFSLAFTVAPGLGLTVLERFGGVTLWGGTLLVGLLAATMMARVRPPPREVAEEG